MTRIVIGQYYPISSPIHRIDPRVKILCTLFYVTIIFFITNFIGFGISALFIAILVKLSQVPPKLLFRSLRPILFILVFSAIINIFLTPGEQIIFSFFFITITWEGILLATLMAIRLTLVFTGSSILTLTTSPIRLTDGIEALLKPLKVLKIPAHDITMMMTIALRFIPALAEEMDKIIKAQKARGADLDTGNFIKRAKSLIPILVPLFVSAFKRADELATAMESKCYRGDINRTKMKVMKITYLDVIASFFMIAFGTILVLTRFL